MVTLMKSSPSRFGAQKVAAAASTLLNSCVGNGLTPSKKGSTGIYTEFIYNEVCGAESIMARDLYCRPYHSHC